MRFTTTRTESSINVAPDFLQKTRNSAKTSEVCEVAETHQTFLEEGAEC